MSTTAQQELETDSSLSTFTSALWFNAALAIAFFCLFNILRTRRVQTYFPRSYVVPKNKQPPPLPDGYFQWIITLLRIPDEELIRCMGLDRFMVLKFLRMGIVVFFVATFTAVPILIPINAVGQLNSEGLNLLTIGNVSDPGRTWAHTVLAIFFTAGLIYYTFSQTREYLKLRREYLLSPEFSRSVVARSLFVPSIPSDVHSVEELKRIFDHFPGGVRRIWINRDLQDLPDNVSDRQKKVQNLESAITKAILATYKHMNKKGVQPEDGPDSVLIPKELRPTHRVSSLPIGLPFVGRKVDSIDYYHDTIKTLNEIITKKQNTIMENAPLTSAFIEFNQQSGAQMAAQSVIHRKELVMAPRYIEIAPTDIIWDNMNIKSYARLLRRMTSLTLTTVIVIFWAIPVIFVQGVSTLDSLSKTFPFLAAVNNLGPTVVGIIQGILPAVALAVLVALVPIIFAFFSKMEGIPRQSFVELSVLHKFFFFQFVDVVLVSTIAGGIFNVLGDLTKNPSSIISLLAEKLPRASTFFITYVMLQATNAAAQNLLQLVPYILSFVLPLLSTTPRDIYQQKNKCPNLNLGTLIPSHTVIFVLGIEYSTVAPLILPFILLYFCMHYFVLLYQLTHVYERAFETAGRAFPRSIRHIYIGMFTWQLTMVGLFGVRGSQAIGQLVVMVILLIVSAFALGLYDSAFKPLLKFLPVECMKHEEIKSVVAKNLSSSDVALSKGKEDDKNGLIQDANTSDRTSSHAEESETTGLRKRSSLFNNSEHDVSDKEVNVDAFAERYHLNQALLEDCKASPKDSEEGNTMLITARRMYDCEAYLHPSIIKFQPTVWLPQDKLGIAQQEVAQLKSLGIEATTQDAEACVNEKKVKISINEETVIIQQKGVPGERPSPAELSDVNDYVRVVVDNYNFIDSLAINTQ
ncbi:hypothetical protein BDF14DRAFT_1744586 [Spinellus fusiger]|nr:hypothetical protein BDF14DRAFT_1744586 [Spinellus fusiger]